MLPQVLKRIKSEPKDDSPSAVDRVNRTVSELRARLTPNASSVAESALKTVNAIQSLFRVRTTIVTCHSRDLEFCFSNNLQFQQ